MRRPLRPIALLAVLVLGVGGFTLSLPDDAGAPRAGASSSAAFTAPGLLLVDGAVVLAKNEARVERVGAQSGKHRWAVLVAFLAAALAWAGSGSRSRLQLFVGVSGRRSARRLVRGRAPPSLRLAAS
jgi:hypothetical protein